MSDPVDGFSDSDRAWFDRLAGRPVSGTEHAEARADAERLRRGLELEERSLAANTALQEVLAPERSERQLQALLKTLRQERLLPPDAGARSRSRWAQVTTWAAAAMLAGLMVVPLVLMESESPSYDEPPLYRGEHQQLRRTVERPREAAEQLAARLKAAGGDARIYQAGPVFMVQLDVGDDPSPALVQALRDTGLAPQPGLLRVEFAAR